MKDTSLASAKVLVIDDLPGVAALNARKIRPHCRAARISSPNDARRAIAQFKPDLLLTDLRMPELSGTALLQSLGLNVPATVICSGSVSAKTLSQLGDQGVAPNGSRAFRTILKSATTPALLGTLRGALLDTTTLSREERVGIIAKLPANPEYGSETEIAKQRELVHAIFERLQLFSSNMSRGLALLEENFKISEWPDWKRRGKSIKQHLDLLAGKTSDSLLSGSLEETSDALHNLRPALVLCDLSVLKLPDDLSERQRKFIRQTLDILNTHHQVFSDFLNASYHEAEKAVMGRTNLYELIYNCFGSQTADNIYNLPHVERRQISIVDPGQKIAAFLGEVQKVVIQHEGHTDFRRSDPKSVLVSEDRLTSKLRDQFSWGSFGQLTLSFWKGLEEGKAAWQYLDHLAPQLLALKDRAYVDSREFLRAPSEGGFTICIRLEKLDTQALEAEKARQASIKIIDHKSFSFFDETINATTIEVNGSKVIVLNKHEFDPARPAYGDACLLRRDDRFIVSINTSGHHEADAQLYTYLRKILSIEVKEAFDTIRSSSRLKFDNESYAIKEVNSSVNLIDNEEIVNMMKAFGYTRFDKNRHFAPRESLSITSTEDF